MQRVKDSAASIMLYVVAALVLAQIVAFVILIPLAHRVTAQSQAGSRARVLQCQVYPISIKVYTAAQRYKLITAEDLKTFKSFAPKNCP